METLSLLERDPFIICCCCCSEIFPNMVSDALLGSGSHPKIQQLISVTWEERKKILSMLFVKKKKNPVFPQGTSASSTKSIIIHYEELLRSDGMCPCIFVKKNPKKYTSYLWKVFFISKTPGCVLDCIQVQQVKVHSSCLLSALNHLRHLEQSLQQLTEK